MLVRLLTVVGAAAYGVSGPLLVAAVWTPLGLLGAFAAAAGWLGLGCLLAVLVVVGRADHRMLRTAGGRLRSSAARLEAVDGRVVEAATRTETQLVQLRTELLATLDARVLGLHATVRELDAGGGRR